MAATKHVKVRVSMAVQQAQCKQENVLIVNLHVIRIAKKPATHNVHHALHA
jgi:hypothetical protein